VKAIVIGAGIGGLATAIALDRAGVEVEVYERVAELGEIGAGISLWANAIRALRSIGLADALLASGAPAGDAGLRTSEGAPLVMPSGELAGRLQDLAVVVHRADLQRVLLSAFGRERVMTGHACTSVEQDDRSATAIFANDQRARGDVLIGADGLHSVVRAALHGDRPPLYSGHTAWRGVVSFDHTKVRAGESWGRGERFGQIPMSEGRVYWFATQNAPEGARSADGEKAQLLRLFRSWHAPIEDLIVATPDRAVLRNDIYDRPPLKRWGDRRITLVGDAAHPMTPNLGQGACQALEDAVALASHLARSTDAIASLRAYETARIPRANQIVLASRRAGWMGQWSHPFAVSLRNQIIKLAGARLQARAIQSLVEG
jgi:2-polyprenyl-6-methoxyphenol hydroxylase-like FAD-dependent oxidoreductase